MTRSEVYAALDSERHYQDRTAHDPTRPDVVGLVEFTLGDGLSAIEYNLHLAREKWYKGEVPHVGAMEYLRKVAGIVVQLGEKYGLPTRPWPVNVGDFYEDRVDLQMKEVEGLNLDAEAVVVDGTVVPFELFFRQFSPYRMLPVKHRPKAR